MKAMVNRIDTHCSLEGFFKDLLEGALAAERVQLDDQGFTYVLHLVGDFSRPEVLHGRGQREDPGTPALVWLYQEAREAAPSQRFDAYRHLGDVALMVAGFFAPHVERARSLVGVDYYVDMGRTAYDVAAHAAASSGFSRLLHQLADKFAHLVEVLSRVAEQTTLPVNRDLASLYARLVKNPGSARLTERMLVQGAFPVFDPKGVAA